MPPDQVRTTLGGAVCFGSNLKGQCGGSLFGGGDSLGDSQALSLGAAGRDLVKAIPGCGTVGGASCFVTAVAAGSYHSLMLTADNRVWAVGQNRYGQLGTSTRVGEAGPVGSAQLLSSPIDGTRWRIVRIAAGGDHSIIAGVHADSGRRVAWGAGSTRYGQLGFAGWSPSATYDAHIASLAPLLPAPVNLTDINSSYFPTRSFLDDRGLTILPSWYPSPPTPSSASAAAAAAGTARWFWCGSNPAPRGDGGLTCPGGAPEVLDVRAGGDETALLALRPICPLGSFGPYGRQPCTPCPAGYFSSVRGASVCAACTAGYFAAEGAAGCLACPQGTWSLGAGAGPCGCMRLCGDGEYGRTVQINGWEIEGLAPCLPCPRDTYRNASVNGGICQVPFAISAIYFRT